MLHIKIYSIIICDISYIIIIFLSGISYIELLYSIKFCFFFYFFNYNILNLIKEKYKN